MKVLFRWKKGRREFHSALHLAWLVIAFWTAASAVGLFALKDTGTLRILTAISLTLWPLGVFWRMQGIHRRYAGSEEGVLRVYSLLLQALAPCFLLWFILLYWNL
ncbi:MAG: hypothetical protein J0L64_15485 [Acidobacteria bacterium]|nr:hypothetical protein [Acidobacteriota bacterium]